MKYTSEIIIDVPVNKIVELFDNADNLTKWMDGLQSFDHLSGVPGQPGAKTKMVFKMGSREIKMIETITVRNLPDEFTATYDAEGVINIVKNRFIKLSEGKTKYITDNESQFKGFMKIIALIMSGSFKKQSYKFMEDFKNFAESQP